MTLKALVIYATITGNNEDVADVLTEALEDLNVETVQKEISQSDAAEFQNVDLCFVVPYTYDEGALPQEGLDFFDDLADLNLTGKFFGVVGSGDVFYGDDYGVAVDKFTAQLKKANATQGAPSLKINLAPDEEDIEKIDMFAKHVVQSAKQ